MSVENSERVPATPVNSSDKENKDPLVITAFQTACLAIMVLLAKFVGDLLCDAIVTESFPEQLRFLILVSMLNFLEIINNWASIKKYFNLYNTPLFLIDVLTLGVFFWQIYILSKLEIESKSEFFGPRSEMLLVIMISYVLIFFLYVLWNAILLAQKGCHSPEDRAENIKTIIRPAGIRIFQMAVALELVLFGVDCVSFLVLDIFILLSCAYTLVRNYELNVFSTIISSKNTA